MTEPDDTPPSVPETTPISVGPSTAVPRSGVPAWLSLLSFLVLAAAIAVAWAFPRQQSLPPPPPSVSPVALADLSGRLDGLAAQLAALGQKLAALPPRPDLGPIEARLAVLEKQSSYHPPSGLAPPDQTALAAALAPLSGRIDALGKSLAGLSARLDRIERLTRIETAASALAAGRPLGTLPQAPPALARFAATTPPTLASLRLSYPEAARGELAASRPSTAGKSLLARLLAQAGDLITLRSGNRVIIGNPAEGTLATARIALEAGDLSACLAALDALPRPLAPAMAEWEEKARALRDAETALASLAGSS